MPAVTTGPIRPLGVGEVLDAAIRIYRRRFKAMVIATAIAVGPALLISALLQVSTAPDPNTFAQQSGNDPEALDLRSLWIFGAATLVATIIAAIAAQVATGATLKSASGAYLDEPADWRESLRFAIRRLPSMLLVVLLTLLATIVGLVACILPGIWIYVGTSMVIPVVLLENLRGTSAISRSWRLVKDRWWATFGTLIVASIIAGFVAGIFALPGQVIGAATGSTAASIVLQSFGSFVGSVLTTPFTAAVTLVLYVDLRVRKEAFDLELLAAQLGVAAPEGGFSRPDMPGFEAPGYGYPSYPGNPNPSPYPQPGWGPPGYPPAGAPPGWTPPAGAPPVGAPPGWTPPAGAPPGWTPPAGARPGWTATPNPPLPGQPSWGPPMPPGPPVPPLGAPNLPPAPSDAGLADRPSAPSQDAPSPSPWEPSPRPPQAPLPPVVQGAGPVSASPPPPVTPPAPQPLPPPQQADADDDT